MMQPGVPDDRRCRKTRKAIRHAFLALLGEKDPLQIQVKELTDAADISRKTFYAHYQEPAAVLGEIEDEVVRQLEDSLPATGEDGLRADAGLFFRSLTLLLQDEYPIFERLLCRSGATRLPEKVAALLRRRIRSEFEPRMPVDAHAVRQAVSDMRVPALVPDAGVIERAVDFIAAGAMSVYLQWFGSGRKTPIDEVVGTIGLLARDGASRLLERVREGEATCG